MNCSYFLHLVLVLTPFLTLFDQRIQFFKEWKALFPAVITTGIMATIIKIALVHFKVIQYDQTHLLGQFFYEIPLESILFSFSLPFFGLAIYHFLNVRYPKNELEKYSLALSNILLGLSIAIIFFAYTKSYAVLTFSLLLLMLLGIEYVNKYRFMYKFYRAFGLLLIFYCLGQLLFPGLNYLEYNVSHTMKFNLIYAPFENYFLLLVQLLSAVYLFEFFKRRSDGAA